jgi:hypothetical protein
VLLHSKSKYHEAIVVFHTTRVHLVNWPTTYAPRDLGGLGILDLERWHEL